MVTGRALHAALKHICAMEARAGVRAWSGWGRLRRSRAARWSPAAAFALFLAVPRPGGDGERTVLPAEAEVPLCRPGHPCADPGPVGWTARLEVVLEERARSLPELTRRRVARALVEESRAAGIDPLLAAAIIDVESGYDARARSRMGARGLMQLLPETMEREAARSGVAAGDPDDPEANVRLGIRYYRRLLDTFVLEDHALMAYNAGPNYLGSALVRRRVPLQLRAYAARVVAERSRLRQSFGIEGRMAVADVRYDAPSR
jgi:soluble lytic murein transglycosylase-like protein